MDEPHFSSAALIARLSLPPQALPALSFCATSREGVEEFIADLPRTNTAEVLNRLYKALPEIAAVSLDVDSKTALLELIRPIVLEYTAKLTAKLAINEKNTRQVSLSLALLKNLALGYKSVAVAASAKAAEQPQQLASDLHAAITVLSTMLTTCWECFFNPPKNLWLELHSLYLLARAHRVESLTLFSAQAMANPALSPRAPYLRILLAAAADPSRFTPQDLKLLLAFLDNHAHLATLGGSDLNGLFTIDTDSDQGPILSAKMRHPQPWHLQLRSEELAKYVDQHSGAGKPSTLPPRLSRQISRYWSREVVRQDEHLDDKSTVTALFGLSRLHRQLTKTRNIEDFVAKSELVTFNRLRHESNPEPDILSIPEKIWHDAPDRDKPIQGTWLRPAEINPDQPITFVSRNATQEPEAVKDFSAIRTNMSRNGACIELASPPENLTPGELVGIKSSDASQWRIGLVRWTRITPQLSRLAGIEFFGKSIIPCAVALAGETVATHRYFPGLILQNRDQSRELLLPSIPFTEQARVVILTSKAKGNGKLLEILESTFHLSIFKLDH